MPQYRLLGEFLGTKLWSSCLRSKKLTDWAILKPDKCQVINNHVNIGDEKEEIHKKIHIAPCNLSEMLKHNQLLYRGPRSKWPATWGHTTLLTLYTGGKISSLSPTCLDLTSYSSGEFSAGRVLQHHHPIHWTLKATSTTLPRNPPIPPPLATSGNTETQPATTQRGPWNE